MQPAGSGPDPRVADLGGADRLVQRDAVRPGVWAAGDVAFPAGQVIMAASAGSTAGAVINAGLIEDEIKESLAA